MPYVQPSVEPEKSNVIDLENDGNNIEGILVALRYLSNEAADAGLQELANTLEDAARYCYKYVAVDNNNLPQT